MHVATHSVEIIVLPATRRHFCNHGPGTVSFGPKEDFLELTMPEFVKSSGVPPGTSEDEGTAARPFTKKS
jgi:hypothetical protein